MPAEFMTEAAPTSTVALRTTSDAPKAWITPAPFCVAEYVPPLITTFDPMAPYTAHPLSDAALTAKFCPALMMTVPPFMPVLSAYTTPLMVPSP